MPNSKDEVIPDLRVPQARVLKGLMPSDPDSHPIEWPVYTRSALNRRVGYSAISTGITRPLRGIPEGSSSGDPHPGLLDMGMVEVVEFDVDGVTEPNYKITDLGIKAFQRHIALHGDNLPKLREASLCTNKRYVKQESQESQKSQS